MRRAAGALHFPPPPIQPYQSWATGNPAQPFAAAGPLCAPPTSRCRAHYLKAAVSCGGRLAIICSMPQPRSVVSSAKLIAICTLVSRVTGLARDILLAQAFGLGWVQDAFSYAFQFPNLFRRPFGEGALAPFSSHTANYNTRRGIAARRRPTEPSRHRGEQPVLIRADSASSRLRKTRRVDR